LFLTFLKFFTFRKLMLNFVVQQPGW